MLRANHVQTNSVTGTVSTIPRLVFKKKKKFDVLKVVVTMQSQQIIFHEQSITVISLKHTEAQWST